MRSLLLDLLVQDEGLKLKPYYCPAKKLSIGIGRNLEDEGITEEEAYYLCNNDIERRIKEAKEFSWYYDLNEVRRAVIICMLFNMGKTRFCGFKRMIEAMENKDYNLASKEMLSSKWKQQVGKRSIRLASLMKSGKI